ncbi:MAG: HEAT repeat domain-containing protein [Anaerolineae bacterium]|nr:MAG: HEAT repeat domain-containing protein [Anaerolineae bacterium]
MNLSERDFLADMQVFLANIRQNAIEAVKKEHAAYERRIRKAGIDSYKAAYATIGNLKADIKLRRAVCSILSSVSRDNQKNPIDKRRVGGSVLRAMQSKDRSLRYSAMELAGHLRLKRAVPLLIEIVRKDRRPGIRQEAIRALDFINDPRSTDALIEFASNHAEETYVRIFAIIALASLAYHCETERIGTVLEKIMLDSSDTSQIRAEAAENLAHVGIADTIPSYIQLLTDPDVELRFWATFGLVTLGQTLNISAAIPVIDRTVAYDMDVLPQWWSVASEAMPALEDYWYRQFKGCEDEQYCSGGPMLISPLLEYHDYQQTGKVFDLEKGIYEYTPIPQSTTLSIDPATFAKQILERWPAAKINVRHPQPEALILDWWMDAEEYPLMGALHRNGYWVFLSGNEVATLEFVMWLREITSSEYPLYIYGWADPGIEINATLGEIGFSEAERRARGAWNEQLGKLVTEVNQMMEKANDQS